ncbi:MAG: NADH:flavin oxidoreductase/NADH oxidase [Bacteroidales bacterium]|jgi:2,4-dienoyl-CoA reductase-like NADH-dependent reductase (Old Yellow Enzyme family)|nr:NADH:flavin oxidoreductase/NADH oxidase [Bacteroidales bacterium]
MSRLFTPLSIGKVTLRNRIAMSPMCQYSAKNGFTNDWHMVHYGSRAAGGAGLIIIEASAVMPEGRITPGDIGIWSDDHIEGFAKIASFIAGQGSVAGIQLAHAGRKASCAIPTAGGRQLDLNNGGWITHAPSEIPFQPGDRIPQQLGRDGIEKVKAAFRNAAVRAAEAGFSIIEIHSAHGYLLQEFLSPLSNHRDDEYGGSFENRTRLLLEVVSAVRSVWTSENPLFVRISCTEWTDGGWTPEESVRLAKLLKTAGADLVDCSSGGNIYNAVVPAVPGYQVVFAESVRKSGILTSAVGLITSATQAESILQEEKADLILLGRELLRNPYFPIRAAAELGDEINRPFQYLRAK